MRWAGRGGHIVVKAPLLIGFPPCSDVQCYNDPTVYAPPARGRDDHGGTGKGRVTRAQVKKKLHGTQCLSRCLWPFFNHVLYIIVN